MNQLYHGDCVDIMAGMEADSVDMTLTSPPYDDLRTYNGYHFDFESIAKGLYRITKQGGVVVWVVGDKVKNGNRSLTAFRQGLFFQEVGFRMHDVMIYQKKNTPFFRSNAYTNAYEFMFVLSKGKPKTFNPLQITKQRISDDVAVGDREGHRAYKPNPNTSLLKTKTNIWAYAVGLGGTTSDKIAFQHPAIFPEKLAEDHILSWTHPNDLVFDPMCGSGTTGKMALLNNRRFIGVDISAEYIAIAKERIGIFANENA